MDFSQFFIFGQLAECLPDDPICHPGAVHKTDATIYCHENLIPVYYLRGFILGDTQTEIISIKKIIWTIGFQGGGNAKIPTVHV